LPVEEVLPPVADTGVAVPAAHAVVRGSLHNGSLSEPSGGPVQESRGGIARRSSSPAVILLEKTSEAESDSPGFTFGFDLNPELLRMSLEGSLAPALPPPVVFVDNLLEAATVASQPRSPALNTSGSLLPAPQVKYAEEVVQAEAGLQPLEEDMTEEEGEEGEVDYEEEEDEWEGLMAAPRLGLGKAGDLLERTDIRNFNYDVIVDFVNQAWDAVSYELVRGSAVTYCSEV